MTGTVAYIQNTLKDYYPPSEIKAFIRLIMERVCDIQPHQFLLCKDKELSEKEKTQIYNIVERLVKYEPIQYIFGKTDFYGPVSADPPSGNGRIGGIDRTRLCQKEY